jgi:peptidoglycan hydrolase-like protein with peptidoglycan-binding domain
VHPLRTLVFGLATVVLLGLVTPPATYAADRRDTIRIQKRLNALHCDAGPADGRLGDHSRSAVVRFQSRVRLPQTGGVGRTTYRRLFAGAAPRCDVRPVPSGTGKGHRIVISQRQNWVWLVGASGRVVAQGGMVDNTAVLRPGGYGVGSYCGRPTRVRLNQSGSVWMDDFVRFAPCGVGFHRIPRYKSTGNQMHADWLLGTDLAKSHGCIRLSRGLAERVWDFTTRPTPVRVV